MRGEHQKVLRAIGVALLNSNLNAKELQRFAEDLSSYEIRSALESMVISLAEAVKFDSFDNRSILKYKSDPNDENLFEFAKRKRISRAKILSAISILTSSNTAENMSSKTIREMLEFFSNNFPRKIEDFKNIVEGSKGDPYLKGIMDRSMK